MNTPLPLIATESARPALRPVGATARFQPASWEYKVAITLDTTALASPQTQDERLQQLFKNGWIFVGGDRGIYYLKRPKR